MLRNYSDDAFSMARNPAAWEAKSSYSDESEVNNDKATRNSENDPNYDEALTEKDAVLSGWLLNLMNGTKTSQEVAAHLTGEISSIYYNDYYVRFLRLWDAKNDGNKSDQEEKRYQYGS
jgi:hypothetical protein